MARTLVITRGYDYVVRLGALLKTRARFIIPLFLFEFSSLTSLSDQDILIICRSHEDDVAQGFANLNGVRITPIEDIIPDEWLCCVGPQNKEGLRNILRSNMLKPKFCMDYVGLMHFEATPDRVLRLI